MKNLNPFLRPAYSNTSFFNLNVGVCVGDNTVSLMIQSHEFTFDADKFLTILLPAFIYLALAAFRFNPESKRGLG